jgi:hypothetical protein
MAKQEDWWTSARGALLVALGLATGTAVVRPSPSPGGSVPAASTPAPTVPGSQSNAVGTDTLAATAPVLSLLADALGVDLEAEAARRSAIAWRDYVCLKMHQPRAADQRVVDALDLFLARFGGPPAHLPNDPATHLKLPQSPDTQVLPVLRAHSLSMPSETAEIKRHQATVLHHLAGDERRRPDIVRVQQEAGRQALALDTVIATLPDYVDSHTRRLFDIGITGVQRAAYAIGYSLESFYLPDWSFSEMKGEGTRHEVEPGALLFRGNNNVRGHLLLVLIVTETPTVGVHRRALSAAIEFASRWRAAERASAQCDELVTQELSELSAALCGERPLKILGPFFSGTTTSLQLELRATTKRLSNLSASRVRIVSGSASNYGNKRALTFRESGVDVSFDATVADNDDVRNALGAYLENLNPHWAEGDRVAVLVEANTAFGQDLRARQPSTTSTTHDEKKTPVEHEKKAVEAVTTSSVEGGRTPNPKGQTSSRVHPLIANALTVRFPLHISRLRGSPAGPDVPALPFFTLPALRLRLEESTQPKDLIPSVTPELTAPVTESALRNLLAALRRERYTAIGIFATDIRDHLFLAREISRIVPDVLMFGTQSDLLYVNREFAPFIKGTIVASTYPLFNGTQLLTPPQAGRGRRDQFSVNAEQGIYNAGVVLMGDLAGNHVFTGHLVDYGSPYIGPAVEQSPPVWLSVVGTSELWPLHVTHRTGTHRAGTHRGATERAAPTATTRPDYLLSIARPQPHDEQREASTRASAVAAIVFVLLCIAVLWYIVGLRVTCKRPRERAFDRAGLFERSVFASVNLTRKQEALEFVFETLDEGVRRSFNWNRTRLLWMFYPPSHVNARESCVPARVASRRR